MTSRGLRAVVLWFCGFVVFGWVGFGNLLLFVFDGDFLVRTWQLAGNFGWVWVGVIYISWFVASLGV